MARVKKTPPRKRQDFVIRSLTLTPATDTTLQALSQEASDLLGWTVSKSAVIRALLRHAEQQGAPWVHTTLFPLIESEIKDGLFWGSKKK